MKRRRGLLAALTCACALTFSMGLAGPAHADAPKAAESATAAVSAPSSSAAAASCSYGGGLVGSGFSGNYWYFAGLTLVGCPGPFVGAATVQLTATGYWDTARSYWPVGAVPCIAVTGCGVSTVLTGPYLAPICGIEDGLGVAETYGTAWPTYGLRCL